MHGSQRSRIPHRLIIAPREIVLCDTRLVRIETRLSKSLARVLDQATGEREDVPLASLRGRAILTDSIQIDQHLESARDCSAGEENNELLMDPRIGRFAFIRSRPTTECPAGPFTGGLRGTVTWRRRLH